MYYDEYNDKIYVSLLVDLLMMPFNQINQQTQIFYY